MRLPQRFMYREKHEHPWKFGITIPHSHGESEWWTIKCQCGFSSFEEDPWEVLGGIIGDVACFQWIDNDHEWFPIGGTCCGLTFRSHDDLANHLKKCEAVK